MVTQDHMFMLYIKKKIKNMAKKSLQRILFLAEIGAPQNR
jgi:hypothetical protein